MANQQDKIIDDIISRIADDTELFNNSVDTAAKKAYSEISQELSKLEKVNGNIKISVNNIKVVNSIKNKLNNLALNPAYKSEVEKFLSAYDDVEKLNQKYFGQVAKDFKPKEVYKEVKQLSIDSVKDALLGDGFKANITNKLVDVINQNMTSGGKMDDLVDQVRIFLTDTKEGDGAFSKYAKTYTTNAINKYNATYNQTITSDLGLEWYKYVGSLLETSREFCKELIDAKKNGMEYIHKSQFDELLKGNINGVQIAINDKTDLPNGMEPGTNVSNLTINRGGWNCGHQFMPVSSEIVPQEYKDKIKNGVFKEPLQKTTTEQQKSIDKIERDKSLKGKDIILQEKSIRKVVLEEKKLVSNYLKNNGNVINTDEARKEFIDIGYKGTNASAVHEASSVLGKKALEKLIEEGKNQKVSFYAGGAGSCKTSTIETLIPGIKQTSDAIIDGNLSHYEKAVKKIDEFLLKGKNVEVAYVYRDPLDAWDAVIKRMLNNKSEMGRAVKSSTFIDNTTGSYKTAKQMLISDLNKDPKFKLAIFDNSLGKGNAQKMDLEKFYSIKFPEDLKSKLREITNEYLRKGLITKEQYNELIQ